MKAAVSATYSSSPADLAEAFRLIAGDALKVYVTP